MKYKGPYYIPKSENEGELSMKKKMSPKKFGGIFITITALLLILCFVVSGVMSYWSTVMDAVFGSGKISVTPATGTENWNTDYYRLNAAGMTKEETAEKGKELARRAEAEGIVLLKNQNNALPLNVGSGITVNALGWSFYYPSLGGSGSGAAMTLLLPQRHLQLRKSISIRKSPIIITTGQTHTIPIGRFPKPTATIPMTTLIQFLNARPSAKHMMQHGMFPN